MGRFSDRWWRGHHFTRDACGSWTPDSNAGGDCVREDGQQGTRRVRRQLRKEGAAADRARKARSAGVKRGRGVGSREELRETQRLAQHAQELRAEAAGGSFGVRTRAGRMTEERRAFFGQANAAASSTAERKVAGADREAAARAAADREAAEQYAARATRRPDKFSARAAARARAAAAADGW